MTIIPDEEKGTAGSSTHGGEWGEQAAAPGEEDDDTAMLRMLAPEAFCLRHAIALYAGAESVRQLCPDVDDPNAGADDDFRNATFRINDIASDQESADLLFALAKRRCRVLVGHYRPEIARVASALTTQKRLSGEETNRIFIDSLTERRAGILQF